MHRFIVLALGLALMPEISSAQAIDCSGGCTVTKYGTANPADFDYRRAPQNDFKYDASDFEGSYFYIRGNPANPGGIDCGPARDFTPVLGQILLREQDGCVPTEAVGCPVEIPQDIPGIAGSSIIKAPIWSGVPGLFDLLSSTPFGLGQTQDPGDPTCLPDTIRTTPSQGMRFVLPAARGGDGTMTYIDWDDSPDTGLFRGGGEGQLCCNSSNEAFCDFIGGFFEYPTLWSHNCTEEAANVFPLAHTPDWIFDGGPGTDFITDPEFEVPDQQLGVCRVNRDLLGGCDQSVGGTGDPCPMLDATPEDGIQNPGEPGFVPDECDFREEGMRSTRPANQSNGFPDPLACAGSLYVLRGSAEQNCYLLPQYDATGDPGEDCAVLNFGMNPRPDLNCDGISDTEQDIPQAPGITGDLCPFLTEFDSFANSDAATGGDDVTGPRGDECECGDQTRDGILNIADILAINAAIFDPLLTEQTCDANGDLGCNVADILAVNQEIFAPGSVACREITPLPNGN